MSAAGKLWASFVGADRYVYTPPELRRFQETRRLRCRFGHKWRRYDATTFRCDRCGGFWLEGEDG